MFKDCSVMLITAGVRANELYRIETDEDTQKEICSAFEIALNNLISNKSRVSFDGNYKPHKDEFLSIEHFKLADEIKDAIRDPLGVSTYQKQNGEFMEIKAIFIGRRIETDDTEKFEVAFQRFRKEQYISISWFNLFFTNDTFHREKDFGISISDSIDCYYTDGELQFSSFHFARQVIDLSEYYRSATDLEVDSFAKSNKLAIEDPAGFRGMANTWIRRKIAMINDAKVLEKYSVSEIQSLATESGISIDSVGGKIVIPNDKDQVKIILGFFDEETYKGPFSQNTYLANSKRQINK